MTATMPCGSYFRMPDFALSAILWCGTRWGLSQRGARRARKFAVSSASKISEKIASASGLPVSRVRTLAISCRRAKIASRKRRSISQRSRTGVSSQSFCASRARRKISGRAWVSVAGKLAITSFVAGVIEWGERPDSMSLVPGFVALGEGSAGCGTAIAIDRILHDITRVWQRERTLLLATGPTTGNRRSKRPGRIRVFEGHQIQTVGRHSGARTRPVPRLEERPNVSRRDSAPANFNQGAHNLADHVAKKRTSAHDIADFVRDRLAHDFRGQNLANHIAIAIIVFRAGRGCERREIALSLEMPCCRGHSGFVQGPRMMQRTAIFERREHAPAPDAIAIRLCLRLPARVKIHSDFLGGHHSNRRRKQRIQRTLKFQRGQVRMRLEMRHLAQGMNARVGAARAMKDDSLLSNFARGVVQRALDGRHAGLKLPAVK